MGMVRIHTSDGIKRTSKVLKLYHSSSYYGSIYLWTDGNNIRAYSGSEYEGNEVSMDSVIKDIISQYGTDVYYKRKKEAEESGLEAWNKFKEKFEKEHYVCPFCALPDSPRLADNVIFPDREELRKHIANNHLKIESQVKIVNDTSHLIGRWDKQVYKQVNFSEDDKKEVA